MYKRQGIKALILTPTRELAIQIGENFDQYAGYTGVKHAVIFGGVPQKVQVDALKRGVPVSYTHLIHRNNYYM